MKTVFITGAAGGIGSALAETFAREGYTPILHYHETPPENLFHGVAIQANLANFNEIENLIQQALKQDGHIDVLVNNAGMSVSSLFTDISPEIRREIFSVNLFSAMECTRLILPSMIHRKNGCILNISSMWGQVGASCEVDYSTSKAGLIGFTKALAKEIAPSGIRVNAIAPGVIRTKMLSGYSSEVLEELADETPLGRLGTPEDVAEMAVFLASEKASFITGQVIGVNGGFVI